MATGIRGSGESKLSTVPLILELVSHSATLFIVGPFPNPKFIYELVFQSGGKLISFDSFFGTSILALELLFTD